MFVEDGIPLFILFVVCTAIMSYMGMAEFVKYAAAEACLDAARLPVAMSRVLVSGAVLSMIGPLANTAGEHLSCLTTCNVLHGYAYFFLIMAGFALISMVTASCMRLPPIVQNGQGSATPLSTLLCRTEVWSSILAQVGVQFVMVTPMSATPIAFVNRLSIAPQSGLISGCIIAHTLCMFLPGLVTGQIIGKVGKLPVMFAGIVFLMISMLGTLVEFSTVSLYTSLMALGVGWNWGFVSSTLLLMASHSPEERFKVTSCNEAVRFTANAIGTVLSSTIPWNAIVVVCSAGALTVAALFCWAKTLQRRTESKLSATRLISQ